MTGWGWIGFVVAAAVGAPLRYAVDTAVAARVGRQFPWGTLLINASGSLILGFLTGLGLYHAFPQAPRLILGTGFCGAYTTFSTFTFETVRLREEVSIQTAARNAAGTLVVCAATAAAGLALATL